MFHKRLLKEFADTRKYTAGIVICQWLSMIANVLFIFASASMMQDMIFGAVTSHDAVTYLVLTAVFLAVRFVSAAGRSSLSVRIADRVKSGLRTMIFSKLLRLGGSYHEKISTSEVVQVSTEGAEQLEFYMSQYVPQFFYSMAAPLTLFAIASTISLKVALVLLVCLPLIPASIIVIQKIAKRLLGKYWGSYTHLGDSFLECLQGLTTLKIYGSDGEYARRMDEDAERFRKITMRVLIMQLNSISVMDVVAYGGAAVGIALSILEYTKGDISFMQCFFMLLISAEFFLPLRMLGSFFHIAMNGMAAADKIFALMDIGEECKGKLEDFPEGDICFQDISFGYEGSGRLVLDGCDVRLPAKGMTAIVGGSGCGKSTLASLLMGEHMTYGGRIFAGCSPGADEAGRPADSRGMTMTGGAACDTPDSGADAVRKAADSDNMSGTADSKANASGANCAAVAEADGICGAVCDTPDSGADAVRKAADSIDISGTADSKAGEFAVCAAAGSACQPDSEYSGDAGSSLGCTGTGRSQGMTMTGRSAENGSRYAPVEIREIAEHVRLRNITRINHSSYIFKGTVGSNLLMGDPQASTADMEAALKQAGLYDELKSRGGLDMAVTERGANLSGGQRQRLALARALLRNSPVYIFDEATSNVDVESEDTIMNVIRQLAETKSVLLISHRLANVVDADRIYVMSGGRICENGTHEELMAENGEYHRMFRMQQELESYSAGGPAGRGNGDGESCDTDAEPECDPAGDRRPAAAVAAHGDMNAAGGTASEPGEQQRLTAAAVEASRPDKQANHETIRHIEASGSSMAGSETLDVSGSRDDDEQRAAVKATTHDVSAAVCAAGSSIDAAGHDSSVQIREMNSEGGTASESGEQQRLTAAAVEASRPDKQTDHETIRHIEASGDDDRSSIDADRCDFAEGGEAVGT